MPKEDITILLVDDDEVEVMGVRRAFKRAKIENTIVVANDGIAALEKLRSGQDVRKPFLILLDINMPRMNGFEFLKEARKDELLRDSLVFMLTTSRAEEDKRIAYGHNVAGYIIKDHESDAFTTAAQMLGQYVRSVEFPL